MPDTMECALFFAAQLRSDNPHGEADAGAAMMAAGRVSRWRRNEACDAVIARGAVACIRSGAVRKFALRPDGHRQIIDLTLARDYLGFAPADPGFFLEAVSNDTVIISFTREQIAGLGARFPAVAPLMQRCAADAIRRLEHHLLVQNRITAREKVSAYLTEMSRRVEPNGAKAIVLPISRYDIADHLGIAVETVSRMMTVLCRRGSITLRTPRAVEIRDPSMFRET
jgi:CRP-like cAMP-binding protein